MHKLQVLIDGLTNLTDKLKASAETGWELAKTHRRRVGVGCAGVFFLMFILFFVVKTPAFQVSLDGKPLFVVKSKLMVQDLAGTMIAEKQQLYGEHLLTRDMFSYDQVFVSRKTLADENAVRQYLDKQLGLQVEAAVIVVDDVPLLYMKDVSTAERLIAGLKAQYSKVSESEALQESGFAEDVYVRPVLAAVDQLLAPDEALEKITTGGEEPIKYVVQQGDTLWQIARNYNIYVDDIMIASDLASDKLSLGQELTIIRSEPYINVVTWVEGSQYETIPYPTETVRDNSARGTTVQQKGQDGEKFVAYRDIRRNGLTAERELLEETVITAATPQIVVQGSAITVASRSSSGSGRVSGYSNPGTRGLIWPTNGVITQYFKGSRHPAIDIANRSMPAILAADEGIVSFAGTQGGYGRMVTIDHGNGMVTRYAHCSSLNVSAGQSVAQGQQIGVMGTTGNSTGIHLHFEVIMNGSFLNPLNYLP
jgi:murein DD-endopeptidase MepM/ murein hydrolase activator NlpD